MGEDGLLRQQAAERVEGMFADPSMRVIKVTRAVFLEDWPSIRPDPTRNTA